jgi:ABC-type transport system involved in multi-copper enzyme maturation permease subunit
MSAAIRAELLRAVSGSAGAAVLAFALLVPLMVVVIAPDAAAEAGLTPAVYSACGASFVTAMFLGSYGVTREYYYSSLERSLVVVRRADLLRAKAVAAGAVALGLGAVTSVAWLGVTAIIVGSSGERFAPSWDLLVVALCSTVSSGLGGVLGSAVGWITRNYYAACALVLGVPFAVELPLVSAAPELERFLPSGALAGIAVPETLGLLPPPAALGVSILWCALALTAAWIVTVRGRA